MHKPYYFKHSFTRVSWSKENRGIIFVQTAEPIITKIDAKAVNSPTLLAITSNLSNLELHRFRTMATSTVQRAYLQVVRKSGSQLISSASSNVSKATNLHCRPLESYSMRHSLISSSRRQQARTITSSTRIFQQQATHEV